MTISQAKIAHFWERVDKSGGDDACWPWMACRTKNGYGRLLWRRPNRPPIEGAHRISFLLTHGWMPEGSGPTKLIVRHTCDNPPCCNPEHLISGTMKENTRDALDRGRFKPPPNPRGAAHPHFKLFPEVVEQVQQLRDSGLSRRQTAQAVGLSLSAVDRAVLRGRTAA